MLSIVISILNSRSGKNSSTTYPLATPKYNFGTKPWLNFGQTLWTLAYAVCSHTYLGLIYLLLQMHQNLDDNQVWQNNFWVKANHQLSSKCLSKKLNYVGNKSTIEMYTGTNITTTSNCFDLTESHICWKAKKTLGVRATKKIKSILLNFSEMK